MKIKPGVNLDLDPKMFFAMGFIEDAWLKDHLGEPTITSGKDSHEDRRSLHNGPTFYIVEDQTEDGLAVDVRTRDISQDEAEQIVGWLRKNLDPLGFDTMLHGEGDNRHIHCEFDPKLNEELFKVGNR